TPSAWPVRNSTVSTPTTCALRRSSSARSGPVSAGGRPSMPASPRVTRRYAICFPASVHDATAAAAPYSMSSGCATMQSARVQSSGSGPSGTSMQCASERGLRAEHGAEAFLEVLERQRVVVGVEGDLVPLVGEALRERVRRVPAVLLASF